MLVERGKRGELRTDDIKLDLYEKNVVKKEGISHG